MEERLFGRERNIVEEFGVYRRIAIARIGNDGHIAVCQDGGMVTAVLTVALITKLIDCAVVSEISEKRARSSGSATTFPRARVKRLNVAFYSTLVFAKSDQHAGQTNLWINSIQH